VDKDGSSIQSTYDEGVDAFVIKGILLIPLTQ